MPEAAPSGGVASSKTASIQGLRAAVFDMDGVLIDTEPVWRLAEASVLADFGIDLTESELVAATGQPINEAIALWRCTHPWPAALDARGDDAVAEEVADHVYAYVRSHGRPMPGVKEAVELLQRLGLRLAIASSSPPRVIDAVCDRLGLEDIRVRCSGTEEVHAKPAPDVYLTAARRLGGSPRSCVAIEDSPTGVLAATAAGMRCIAIPDPLLAGDPGYQEADVVLTSLCQLDEATLRMLGARAPGDALSALDEGPLL